MVSETFPKLKCKWLAPQAFRICVQGELGIYRYNIASILSGNEYDVSLTLSQ